MSLTARHKKPGAFEKLVQSLEITSPEKREKIIVSLEADDPVFMDRVKRSMMSFTDLKDLKIEILMEVVYAVGKMEYLALALYKLEDQELVDKFLKCIPPKQMPAYKEAVENLAQVTKGQREGAQFKLIEAARKVESEKALRIKPYALE